MADAAAKKRRRCMELGISALPEDALLQVLSRVGNIKDVFMFAVTCRHYLRRFTDPVFLRGLCPGQGARLLGFLFQESGFTNLPSMTKMRMAQRTSVCAPTFLPAPGSPLGPPKARALTSFLAAAADDTFNYAVPLAARRGIVLMRLVPRTLDATDNYHFGLCNPVTGERHVIPPLDFSAGYVCGYAIITAADNDHDGKQQPPSSSFSQLLLITRSKHNCSICCLYSYSAATHTWSAPTVCLDGRRFFKVTERSAVVHQGAAHWLWIDQVDNLLYKLSIELKTTRVSFTKLPVCAGGSSHLRVSRDDKLSVACVYLVNVTVWTQQSQEGGDDNTPTAWLRTVIKLPEANYPLLEHPRGIWFNFDKGSLLMLHSSNGIFVLDLEKKVMEKVMDYILPQSSGKLNETFVPYEMDLVEVFVRQLGGLCKGLTK